MLVLSRKMTERIVINLGGHDVFIDVVGVIGNSVRLGITAPPEVAVHRQEVWARLSEWRERKQSPRTTPGCQMKFR
jgi:carbon storage regulator